ncbi:DUF2336 domain-containing protein [Jiella sp. M17.18]|uniref:DUF2336 domain-containing protein n=1 Tax=Jiella sp. M17.18 TaxID=3234247 RepID=UPI0034DEFEAD
MILQRFARWSETATTAQRVEAAETLAGALVAGEIAVGDRHTVETTLTLMLDDPSPRVRRTMAEILAYGLDVPRALVLTLCADNDSIACPVAEISPVLTDDDLVDLVAVGSEKLKGAIAARPVVSLRVGAALAELGGRDAVLALCDNANAALAEMSFRRIVERFGHEAEVRGALLARPDLPIGVRQALILRTGEALAGLPLLCNLVGAERARRVTLEAGERATAILAEELGEAELPRFVEHLRASGQLTMALLIRTVASGNIDLFTTILSQLSPLSQRRVRAVVAEGRETAFRALVSGCGLPPAAAPLFQLAIGIWRDIARRGETADAQTVLERVTQRLSEGHVAARNLDGFPEMMQLLRRLTGEAACGAAKDRARRLAA